MQEKSKIIFEDSKEGTIGARIAVLLKKLDKSVTELEKEGGVGNGTLKSWKEKSTDFSSNVVDGFKRKLQISEAWWTTGKGEVFDKNGTYVKTPSDNKEKPMAEDPAEIYKKIVEGETEYILIPRSVLQEKYRLVSLEQFQKDKEQMEQNKADSIIQQKVIDKLLDQNERLILTITKLNPELLVVEKGNKHA